MITITAIEILDNKITYISQKLYDTENNREALGEYRNTYALYANQSYYLYNFDTQESYIWKGSDVPKNLESDMDSILYQFQRCSYVNVQQITDSVIMVTIPSSQTKSILLIEDLVRDYDFETLFEDGQDETRIIILKLN